MDQESYLTTVIPRAESEVLFIFTFAHSTSISMETFLLPYLPCSFEISPVSAGRASSPEFGRDLVRIRLKLQGVLPDTDRPDYRCTFDSVEFGSTLKSKTTGSGRDRMHRLI